MAISKRKHLSQKEVESLIIDATEQPIERPKKGQRPYYSGKRNATLSKRNYVLISKAELYTFPSQGPIRCMILCFLNRNPLCLPTRGFLLIQVIKELITFIKKWNCLLRKAKKRPLDKEEKDYNKALSRIPVRVENIIGDIKTFRILSNRYRNKCKRYNIKFNIIAGIVNLKNGFAPT